jgi:ABC-type enterochelin transport system ATPase subunit
MALLDEINAQNGGAKFVRADLHIHSYGQFGSYDVTDTAMTPQNIVDTAIAENLQVIAITDHNEIQNVNEAINYSQGRNIFVVPGVELSTSDGHLLVYLPNYDALRQFYGRLTISADKRQCQHNITHCLDLAGLFGGFGVAAHIELDSGFENYMKGYTPFKEAIFKHRLLFGLEISNVNSEPWFTDRDTIAERKALVNVRRTTIGEDSTYDIAKLMSSDAHTLAALGRNASGNRKLTRLKLDVLDFQSFKIALIDSTARVRIEDLIPPTVPQFVGIKFDGGFLDGQVIKFSKNLTCIIGGRGAGKSTVIESLRSSSGNNCRTSILDNEVWPDRISLLFEDEVGRQQVFVKDKLNSVVNQTDPQNGITQIEIESFGQGETAETIQHSGKDSSVLMTFFDSFINFGSLVSDDATLRQELLDNQSHIERLTLDVSAIGGIEAAKKNAEEQLGALKAKSAKEVVELEEALANETTLRKDLIEHLKSLLKGIQESLSDKTLFNLVLDTKDEKIIIGKDEFNQVKDVIGVFSTQIDSFSENLNAESATTKQKLNEILKTWREKEGESQNKIEQVRKDLEAKGIKLDIAFIRKVTKDASEYGSRLNDLNQKKKQLEEFKVARHDLLKKRKQIKDEIYKKRLEFVYKVNQSLKSTVIDYFIDVKLEQGTYSPELAQIIKDAMGWRTSQVPKADIIVKSVPYYNLLNAIYKGNANVIESIEFPEGAKVFTKGDSESIINTLNITSNRFLIERCKFEDVISIKITRDHVDSTGKKQYITKDISQLSLGQQQSILLSILLFSNRNCPLIIDQPEDNLDSEFIYKTLVKNLRKIKEHRQVIIVTHNANIAVLGDAELIVPLKSSSDKSTIIDRGAIDNGQTKKVACAILEGGEKAFKKRKEIYNL